MSTPTPRSLGYRMPAEWERHEATWLSWPHREGISFPDRYEAVPTLWLRMIEELSPGELVHVNVADDPEEAAVRALLAGSGRVRRDHVFLHRIPTDEPWCRDHGPMFVVRDGAAAGRDEPRKGRGDPAEAPSEFREAGADTADGRSERANALAVVDWRYNAWGGKYPGFERDDRVPAHVAALLGVPVFEPGLVMEGGSLDVNGRGTLLTTEACLLNPNRNPTLERGAIERALADYLGVTTIVWLGEGIVGDDTDGHIDDITRFVDPTTVVTVVERDPADPNHRPLHENLRRLRTAFDQDGRPLRVVELPMPGVVELDGQRLPASYANFYVGNEVVLVPIFGHANDTAALEILARCFPTRRVVGIESTELLWGLGAFHCATQQQPAVAIPVFRNARATSRGAS